MPRQCNLIVFCDVDGVLNNPGCYGPGCSGTHVPAHPPSVAALNYLTNVTGAMVVVSSTWRLGGLMFCREKFHEWGVIAPIIDITAALRTAKGDITISQPRGKEIDHWLHADNWDDISGFVILDDDSDMDPHADRLVQTSGHVGLTMADARRAVEVIRRPWARRKVVL